MFTGSSKFHEPPLNALKHSSAYSVSREHLYRRHKQPKFRCGRCWQPFKDQAGHLDHQRMPEPCCLREMEHVEGFDAVQEGRLRSRKKAKGVAEQSEAEKWRDVYKILFPHVEDDDIPSP